MSEMGDCRRIGGLARLLGDHTLETHFVQIERFNKRIDHMDRIVFAYPILQAFRQERQLRSIRPFNETSHPYPPSGNGGIASQLVTFHTASVTSGGRRLRETSTIYPDSGHAGNFELLRPLGTEAAIEPNLRLALAKPCFR